MIPLFEQYPTLKEKLPYVSLGELPTPVQRMDKLGESLGIGQLYIKRDDISGRIYGGNKVRKLEFILGEAMQSGAKEVMAFGAAGSNHALATAIYAHQLGIKSISMLMPQPNAKYVRRNLMMSYYCGAELHACGSNLESITNMPLVRLATAYQQIRHRSKTGYFPHLIPPGGSSPVGVTGFVNAALELQKQISDGKMPEPDYIYVASGTMGTAVGLTIGLKIAGLNNRLVSIGVTSEKFANTTRMLGFINKTAYLLHSLDSKFPELVFSNSDIYIRHEFFGRQYALFTEDGMKAVSLTKGYEGIKLDGTYTGKTMAAVIADAKSGHLRDTTVLFWNTLNSRDFSDSITGLDYHKLPRDFHHYFKDDVQPLDRESNF
jgi:1-aminocyclopropane-1-carboxylate deaminase/D-cysteine desulfhydrase-like pyridoxal-dependent ACC family enzyme